MMVQKNGFLSILSNIYEKWCTRYTITIMTFLGQMISYQLRNDLNLAIVAMVKISKNTTQDIYSDVCPNYVRETNNSTGQGEFFWTSQDQGIILGAFFWGYVATQIPGGILSEKYGAKWVFGLGMLLTAIFHLLTPLSASIKTLPKKHNTAFRWVLRYFEMLGKWALIVSRIIQGVGEGVNVPATQVLISQWSPPLERSRIGAFIYAGNQLGTVTAMILSGLIIHSGFLGGWEGVFYTFGIICLVWFFFWCFLVYSKPSDHPRISSDELEYIQKSQGDQVAKKKVFKTPWAAIFRSMAFWAIFVAQMGNGWGLYTLLTGLPTYMSNVLKFDIKQNSYLSALPYFIMFIFSTILSGLADFVRTRKILSTGNTRKIANTLGHWGPSLALIFAGLVGCDRLTAVFLLTVAVGFSGGVQSGYQLNHIDIAPNHAGILMGIGNSASNLLGIVAPYVSGVIIKDSGSLSDWRLIFFIAAGIYLVDNLFYIIFAKGDTQDWNDENYKYKAKKRFCKSQIVPIT